MKEITQQGAQSYKKGARKVTIRFPKPFLNTPAVTVRTQVRGVPRELKASRTSRLSFDVKVNAIPGLDIDNTFEWSAVGEIEPLAFKVIKIVGFLGAGIGAYAALVELRWVPNVMDLISG